VYNALTSLKSNTDKPNNDLEKTYGLGAALAGPGAFVKYGMGGSAVTGSALLQTVLAGAFVKTYFITVPSWLSGIKQTDNQFKSDVAACGGH
jgi:hypothetical protein